MNILINGVGFHNKGAELMFRAIIEHFREKPQVTGLAVTCPCSDKQLARYAPCKRFESMGSSESFDFDSIHAVVDASGFAFGDQWDSVYVKNLSAKLIKFAKAGKKVILLPQAFGPFLRKDIRPLCRELFSNVDLIFPRDRISFDFIQELVSEENKLYQAPDFTNLVEGRIPNEFSYVSGRGCILPNARMMDRTSPQTAEAYLHFLEHVITTVKNKGIDLFMLFHDRDDYKVVSQLPTRILENVPKLELNDPLEIKGAIGKSLFVIGSRFHGLINAFSQNIPCLGTSWSHKYQTLFEEYGCPDFLITDLGNKKAVSEKLNFLVSITARTEIAEDIEKFSRNHKMSARNMWKKVDTFLFT